MTLGHEKALQEMEQLNEVGVTLVLMELLKKGKLSYVHISKLYVTHLEEKARENEQIRSRAFFLLAACTDPAFKRTMDKEARTFLYERGFFEGSIYGDNLKKEFGQ